MISTLWRFNPLDVGPFPLGKGPFRARGLAFMNALRYIDERLPGGRAAFLNGLGPSDPYAPYYDQVFVAGSDYDVSPLVRLFSVAAGIEAVPVGRFVEERARWSGKADSEGVWKPLLKGASVEEAVERTRHAFNRYFQPAAATAVSTAPGRFEGELSKVPVNMDGLYVHSTAGFILGALDLAGAKNPRIEWQRPAPEGEIAGVGIEKVRFVARWA